MRRATAILVALLTTSCSGAPAASPPESARVVIASATGAPSVPLATPSRPPWRATARPFLGPNASDGFRAAIQAAEWGEVADFNGRPIPVAVVRPQRPSETSPIVVYLHSDGGLVERDLNFAAWLASEGFFVVVPCWQPSQSPRAVLYSGAAPLRTSARDVVRDINSVAGVARSLAAAPSVRLIVMGHSGGGAAAVLAGSMGGRVDSVVALAAPFAGDIEQRWGTTVTQQVGGLAVPLLIFHGTADTQAKFEWVKTYEALAREKGKRIETLYVEDQGHDFFFVPELFTPDLKQRLIAFLRRP